MAHDEFTIHLVSSASMNIFPDNTLANFKNFLSQEINLEDDWRVAISEIIFPANLYNVTDSLVKIYRKQNIGKRIAETIQDGLSGNTISRKYRGESVKIKKGSYDTVESLIEELKNSTKLDLTAKVDPITGILNMTFVEKDEGITFLTPQIPSILGFDGVKDMYGIHIGYKMNLGHEFGIMTDNTHDGNYPVDLSAGTELMFIYLDIIEHQLLGDTKSPLLRVIDTNRRVKNGSVCNIEPNHRKVFSNLEYKKILVKNIQTIQVELRTETGNFVPFAGTGKVVITLTFKKFFE